MTIGMCSPSFLSWLRDRPANATFTSTTTITGILEAFGTQIRSSVYEEVQESIAAFGCFVYIGDESADTNNVEEAVPIVRYLHKSGRPQESTDPSYIMYMG